MPGRNVGPTCGQREKSGSCLKRGEQISFGESRAEESASIAAGVPILRKVKRARYLTNRERDGSRRVLVRVETSASMYERDDGRRSDEGSAGAGSSDVNSLQKINNATIRRSERILVDPRVLLLRFCRFGSELSHVPLTSRLSSFRNSFNVGILCIDEIARPLHDERWDLPSNLEGRARRWIRQKGSPCPRQPIYLAWVHVSTRRSGLPP